ncbi:MAG TPA: hypothetical protein VLU43_03700 [Anaeromyxobacteraceae bacterium]|nr:hypothetical protein [Anaeromyxobacteraceae bacterium]
MAAVAPRWAWLRSQGLGILCGFATVLLLAVGSVVIAATRDGASAAVGLDDLRGFFSPPSWAHLWLYLLLAVAGLYALNASLATWDTVSRRWRAGVRAPSAYAASVIHVAFLLGLAAHAVGGFLGSDPAQFVLTRGWQELPGFGDVRLVALEVDALPDGMPRRAEARLELRDAAGRLSSATAGYNAPLSRGLGARVALLGDWGRAWVARVASGADGCALAVGQGCRIGAERVTLVGFAPGDGGGAAALLRVRGVSGAEEERAATAGGLVALRGGRPLEVEAIAPEPAVALRVRESPGNPWALAAAIAMVAGVTLLWRRLAGRRGPDATA